MPTTGKREIERVGEDPACGSDKGAPSIISFPTGVPPHTICGNPQDVDHVPNTTNNH